MYGGVINYLTPNQGPRTWPQNHLSAVLVVTVWTVRSMETLVICDAGLY